MNNKEALNFCRNYENTKNPLFFRGYNIVTSDLIYNIDNVRVSGTGDQESLADHQIVKQ